MVIDKKEKHTYLIDIAIPNDKNVVAKEEEKREIYTPLEKVTSHWHHIKKLYRKPSETGPTKIH